MKLRIVILLTVLAVTFFSACGPGPDRPAIRRLYYAGGHVKSEVTYIHDSIKDGNATYYFGRENNYSVYMDEYFKNGGLDSVFKEYYPNGLVKEQGMHSFGVPMGNFYFYYPNGKLKGYNAVGYDDKTFYAVLYDSTGRETYKKGPGIVADSSRLLYDGHESISIMYSVAEPPHSSNEVKIGIWSMDDSTHPVAAIPYEPFKPTRSYILYKKQVGKPGKYKFVAVSALFDSTEQHIVRDTVVSDVIIK